MEGVRRGSDPLEYAGFGVDASSEGTSASARECPRVTAVYELDKSIGLFAGLL